MWVYISGGMETKSTFNWKTGKLVKSSNQMNQKTDMKRNWSKNQITDKKKIGTKAFNATPWKYLTKTSFYFFKKNENEPKIFVFFIPNVNLLLLINYCALLKLRPKYYYGILWFELLSVL